MPWFYYELTSVMGEVMALSDNHDGVLMLAGASHGICLS
jgi:hypothetical protein